MSSAIYHRRNNRSGTADTEIGRDDDTRVDLDRCNWSIRARARRSFIGPKHDAARRSGIPGDGIGGNDARGRRGCDRLCNVPPAGRSRGQEAIGTRPLRPRFLRCHLAGCEAQQDQTSRCKARPSDSRSAWLVEGDLSRASLTKANIFAAQMQRATLDGANLSGARITADLTGARLVGALLSGANLSADMKNQSMGLMRAVLKSSNLERAILRDADLSRVDLEFASLKNTDLTNASLRGAALGGATLAGVTVNGTDFNGADLASTRLIEPIGLDAAKNLDKAQNIDRLLRE